MCRNKARTFVTIIGVILTAAMISAILILGYSVQKYMVDYAREVDGDWHVYQSGLPESQIAELEKDEEIKRMESIRELGYVDLSKMEENENVDFFFKYLYLQSLNKEAAKLLSVKLSEGGFRKMRMRSFYRKMSCSSTMIMGRNFCSAL